MFDDDKPKEACGVYGITEDPWAARRTATGLIALQHRGQESAGIAVVREGDIYVHKAMGLVSEVFTERALAGLDGTSAIGHVRYATSGASSAANAQPIYAMTPFGPLALAHNGNLVNAKDMRRRLEGEGVVFASDSDTEVIARSMARSASASFEEALGEAMGTLKGGYALVLLTTGGVFALRDPSGLRPLALGKVEGRWVVASESCAFAATGGTFVRDVAPGELVHLDGSEIRSTPGFVRKGERALCAFEYIYFARLDSEMDGRTIYSVRLRLGEQLFAEAPAAADIVVGVPDSSLPSAQGYARAAGLPQEMALSKNRYVGRTFILPTAEERHAAVRVKLTVIPEIVAGKRVVLVDDSLVRGTTARHLVALLRQAGAVEIHVRVASPPYRFPCHYGINTSATSELMATQQEPARMAAALGADSLHFLSPEGVTRAIGTRGCLACFTGKYPVPVPVEVTL